MTEGSRIQTRDSSGHHVVIDIKAKLERLDRIASGFLERDLDADLIARNPSMINETRILLEENLWMHNIDPDDPEWCFQSDLHEIESDNPGTYSWDKVINADIETGSRTILYFHGLLKTFWNDFKTAVFSAQQQESVSNEISGLLFGMDIKDIPTTDYHLDSYLDVQFVHNLNIRCSFEGGPIHFFRSSVNAIPALLDLLQDIPVKAFRKCKDGSCGKCFVLTSRHKKKYCNHACAARNGQKLKRENDRQGYNQYHKDYRRGIVPKVKSSKETQDGQSK